ncbi:MAG: glycerol-3-phosphate acyltransferase, partial [Chloroflexi bacterium]|nr:glycerol-3-phosphate acyltransferase [Chloroflexota bacterium]
MDLPDVFRLIASIAAGYLLGSVPFAYLAARAADVDIFHVGTGNPGASNIFRNVSRRVGAFVFLADILK